MIKSKTKTMNKEKLSSDQIKKPRDPKQGRPNIFKNIFSTKISLELQEIIFH